MRLLRPVTKPERVGVNTPYSPRLRCSSALGNLQWTGCIECSDNPCLFRPASFGSARGNRGKVDYELQSECGVVRSNSYNSYYCLLFNVYAVARALPLADQGAIREKLMPVSIRTRSRKTALNSPACPWCQLSIRYGQEQGCRSNHALPL